MPYLVDGSNLCGAARDRRLGLPQDEQEMVRRLAGFAASRRTHVRVVFDGPAEGRRGTGRAHRAGSVRVQYSGAGRIADDVIVDLVRGDNAPADLIVVTSDRELKSRVRSAGGKVMGCVEFARTIQRAGATSASGDDKPLPGDVEEWERWFRERGKEDLS